MTPTASKQPRRRSSERKYGVAKDRNVRSAMVTRPMIDLSDNAQDDHLAMPADRDARAMHGARCDAMSHSVEARMRLRPIARAGLCTNSLTPPRLATSLRSRLADPPPPGEGGCGTLGASMRASKTRGQQFCISRATRTVILPWRGRVAAERTRGGG